MQAPSSLDSTSGGHWHALAAQDVLQELDTDDLGLSSANADSRLHEHGRNELPVARQRSPLRRFAGQFNNALIYFLLAAAILSAWLGHTVDASVIMLVVLVNAIVGFVQEGRAEQALNALHAMLAPSARVVRDGQRRIVAVPELVPESLPAVSSPHRGHSSSKAKAMRPGAV